MEEIYKLATEEDLKQDSEPKKLEDAESSTSSDDEPRGPPIKISMLDAVGESLKQKYLDILTQKKIEEKMWSFDKNIKLKFCVPPEE